MVQWTVWLLLIVVNAASISDKSLRMSCPNLCFLFNFQKKGDTFAFQQISNTSQNLYMQNVLMKRLDLSILEQLPAFIVELSIHSSDRLKRISVPKAINVIHIIESGLRRIDIFEGSSLTKLNVYDCDMTRLPRSIRNAPNLKLFRIDKCKLSNIDLATFCDYPYLRDLRLNGNKIRYVVNTSKRNCSIYSSVTLLELGNNMLTTVNMELFNAFTKLKALSLYNNKIVSITGQLALDSLSNLLMGGNRLEHLDLCGWYVPSMESVLLSLNRFTKIPECLNHWKSVSSLMLNHNQFTSFSIDKLAGMSNLTNLYLQCNKLTEIELNSVFFPPNLKKLIVDNNNLTLLDLSFILAQDLVVQASNNFISSFNQENSSLNVTSLTMEGNPIDCSWATPLERLYGECVRNEEFDACSMIENNIKLCSKHRLYR
ncbi:protein phosphatase 1 regulatory subunit pprA-like [Anopheles gambiae]|uniref:protein phosphatase 1 regulatory subunit pprA-like n=1 Tax=Anopheles gambiae TaxID=7165 RepID=UPI002AC9E400|nr:protein phosphatase 1 regulatory subunit pprA-like [Anopheles gambiae]